MVTCGERQFADPKPDTLTNPTVVIEVLSDSTRDYDLGRKFHHYRTIESLREYLTVDQDTPHVEHHVRQPDNTWVLTDYADLTATLHLALARLHSVPRRDLRGHRVHRLTRTTTFPIGPSSSRPKAFFTSSNSKTRSTTGLRPIAASRPTIPAHASCAISGV